MASSSSTNAKRSPPQHFTFILPPKEGKKVEEEKASALPRISDDWDVGSEVVPRLSVHPMFLPDTTPQISPLSSRVSPHQTGSSLASSLSGNKETEPPQPVASIELLRSVHIGSSTDPAALNVAFSPKAGSSCTSSSN